MEQLKTQSTIPYRSDIDGLRAVAVLAVTAFHLGFQKLDGGFIGVDVFFVISGYLITAILETKISKQAFTFRGFYTGRIRRLIPAVLTTIASTFILAVILMTPDDFIAFGKSAIAATLSVSNVLFFFEAGYWDRSSDMKPLLHTWSLGVEEQFYLVWPALLVLVFKYFQKWAGVFFFTVSLIGLVAAEFMQRYSPSAAFYLFPFRIFEFSLGALTIYIGRTPIWRSIMALPLFSDATNLIGITFILISFFTYSGSIPFPGIYALPPLIGTMLVVLSGTQTSPYTSQILLTNPIMNWFGRVSYSMYLVHWPLIAMFRYKYGPELSLIDQISLAGAILTATIALHYGIENRFRFPKRALSEKNSVTVFNRQLFLCLALFSCALIVPSAHAILNKGWIWRFPNILLTPEMIDAGMDRRFNRIKNGCRIDQIGIKPECNLTHDKTNVLVFGNSHEPDGYNFLSAGYENHQNLKFFYFGSTNRCTPIISHENIWISQNKECVDRMDRLFSSSIGGKFDVIVYSSNKPFAENKNTVVSILETLKSNFKHQRILVLGGFINTTIPCARIINEEKNMNACKRLDNTNYFENSVVQNSISDRLKKIADSYIDRVALLCEQKQLENCLSSTPNDIPLMYDNHHQSLEYTEHTGRLYAETEPSLFDSPVGWPTD